MTMKNIKDKIARQQTSHRSYNIVFISINRENNEAFLWLSVNALAAYLKVTRGTIINKFKLYPVKAKKNTFVQMKNHDVYLISNDATFYTIEEFLEEE
jgi:sarcosine oxidase delta subunit